MHAKHYVIRALCIYKALDNKGALYTKHWTIKGTPPVGPQALQGHDEELRELIPLPARPPETVFVAKALK